MRKLRYIRPDHSLASVARGGKIDRLGAERDERQLQR